MNRGRVRQVGALLLPTLRSVRPWGLVGALVVGGAMLWVLEQTAEQPLAYVRLLRAVAALLAIGAVAYLDDPAAPTCEAAPLPLAWRRSLRAGLALALGLAAWGAVAAWASLLADPDEQPIGLGGLTVQAVALIVLLLAATAVAARLRGEDRGSLAAAPALVAGVVVAMRLPHRWSLFADGPGDADWAATHARWVVVAVVALAVYAAASRDPAAGRWLRRPVRGVAPGAHGWR